MKNLIDYSMTKFRKMDVWDVSVFKLCLVIFGMLVGIELTPHGKRRAAPFLWLSFIGSYAYLIYRIFFGIQEDTAQEDIGAE